MSEVRYYTDENVSRAIIRGLRQRGIDVLSAPEAQLLGATDTDHLEFAHREGRTIVTRDDDFLTLAAQGASHAGIVYAPQGVPVGRVIQGLVLIFQMMTAEEMAGKVEFI